MTQPTRRLLIAGLLATLGGALAGCGFTPMYASGEHADHDNPDVTAALASLQIRPIADRDGMKLRQTLRERMQPGGLAGSPQYGLDVQMRSDTQELGIRQDATASHANLIYTARFAVSEGGQRIYSDTVQAIVSYNILDDQYATVTAIANARDRAIKEIGEEIKTRVAIFFQNRFRQTAASH